MDPTQPRARGDPRPSIPRLARRRRSRSERPRDRGSPRSPRRPALSALDRPAVIHRPHDRRPRARVFSVRPRQRATQRAKRKRRFAAFDVECSKVQPVSHISFSLSRHRIGSPMPLCGIPISMMHHSTSAEYVNSKSAARNHEMLQCGAPYAERVG